MYTFVLSALTLLPNPVAAPTPAATFLTQEDDFEAKITAAGEDVAKLLELADAFEAEKNRDGARATYKRILELDDSNEKAHKALRHHFYDGKWFTSYAKLSKYRREEAKRMKEEFGMVRYEDGWVLEADLPYLRMGWTKTEAGTWQNPADLLEEARIKELKEAGHTFRPDDSTWIAKEDESKWQENLWRCGDEWLPMEEANTYHGELRQWWELTGEHFVTYATTDWEGGNWARWHADLIYPEMVRVFGKKPTKKPHFIVAKSIAQYNELAAGSQENQTPGIEIDGFSSVHHSFFAEAYFDFVGDGTPENTTVIYKGCGVGMWDKADDVLKAWGPYSIRHAAAQSYIEAIDPSWLAISEFINNQGGQPSSEAFWGEKDIPRWLRYGAASFVERYASDAILSGGSGFGVRDWAFSQLGELRPVADIVAFGLDLNDIDGSTQLILQAGALVSFMMDGENAAVKQAHAALKSALMKGEDTKEPVAALEKALTEAEADFKAHVSR